MTLGQGGCASDRIVPTPKSAQAPEGEIAQDTDLRHGTPQDTDLRRREDEILQSHSSLCIKNAPGFGEEYK